MAEDATFSYTGGPYGLKFVQTAYDRAIGWYLRPMPMFRSLVDKYPGQQAMPGQPVVLSLNSKLAVNKTPLEETVDPDAVAIPAPTTVSVTPHEYGLTTVTTLKLDKLVFSKPEVEKVKMIGDNMGDTIDELVRDVVDGATNKAGIQGGTFSTGANYNFNNIVPADELGADAVATAVTLLRRRLVKPKGGTHFLTYIHPDVAHDIRREAAGNTWVDPHTYGGDTSNIYAGTVGIYAGAQFVETTRCTTAVNTNATPATVYNTYFFGQECLVELPVVEPGTRIGVIPDKFQRFHPLGWYAFLGWSIYRQEAIQIVQSSSSLAAL